MQLFIEQLLNGLAAGAMYSLITLGLALIYGVMKILHVAHASVYTAGAYMGLYLYTVTGNIFLAVLGSMAFCACLGVLIERFIYFPLLKYPPYVPLISSIAMLIAIEELCRLVAGPEIRTFPANLPFPSITIGDITISSTLTAVYCISLAVLVLLWLLMTKTELGLAIARGLTGYGNCFGNGGKHPADRRDDVHNRLCCSGNRRSAGSAFTTTRSIL